MRAILLAGVFAGLSASVAVANPNLLINGSFEQGTGTAGQAGTFTGWTIGGTGGVTPGSGIQRVQYGPNTTVYGDNVPPDPYQYGPDAAGANAAFFVDDVASETLSQTIAVTGGNTYSVGFGFFETLTGAANPNFFSFTAVLGGQTIASIISGDQYAAGTWNPIQDTFTATADGNATFTFSYASGPTPAKDVILDDVYVVAGTNPIPAPGALSLLGGLGLLGIATLRRARRV